MPKKQPKCLPPIHPGEVLQDLLREGNLTVNILATALGVPAVQIEHLINGQQGIAADTAQRLARHFGTSAQLWLNLQSKFNHAARRSAGPRPAASPLVGTPD